MSRATHKMRSHPAPHRDPKASHLEPPETFLQPAEVQGLTGRVRRHAQVQALRSMGIEHRVRPDGDVAILRAHISKVFDGNPEATSRNHHRSTSPNWLAI